MTIKQWCVGVLLALAFVACSKENGRNDPRRALPLSAQADARPAPSQTAPTAATPTAATCKPFDNSCPGGCPKGKHCGGGCTEAQCFCDVGGEWTCTADCVPSSCLAD